jgi:hypothetical protein
MCRGKRTCTELKTIDSMHRDAPLPPPQWIRDSLPNFYSAIVAAAEGDLHTARAALAMLPDRDTLVWCIEHGQVSGNFRRRLLGHSAKPASLSCAGPRNPKPALIKVILERDNYHCRYCDMKVLPREVLKAASDLLGSTILPFGRRNGEKHGAALVSIAYVDHVLAWNHGGVTHPENLVTACWTCNFGKHGHSLAALGLTDPRSRPPQADGWDGLTSILPRLQRMLEAVSAPTVLT